MGHWKLARSSCIVRGPLRSRLGSNTVRIASVVAYPVPAHPQRDATLPKPPAYLGQPLPTPTLDIVSPRRCATARPRS